LCRAEREGGAQVLLSSADSIDTLKDGAVYSECTHEQWTNA